ncbi:tetratricopeptide repeat protein [Halarcobacter sp.]|uniref:tetratricopeptide repeat protein n=1 Tax=Halarcobacter sp. TaxID=2321133 RepID=UPI003B0035C0
MMLKKILLIMFLCFYTSAFAKMHMSKSTYNSLLKAQKLIEKDDYKTSKKILEELIRSDSKNDYEKSYILQTLSNIYIHEDNYKKVAKAYKQIIKYNAFEKDSIDKIKFSLSKIYLSLEKYKPSIKLSNELLNSKVLKKNDVYETLILAYYYEKKYKKSINYSKKYFSSKKEIKESWYKILYSSYVEIKDYNNAIKTMEIMVKLFSKNESYWVQLASLYQEKNRLKDSLATLELAYKNGVLKNKNNILYFINISLQNGVYKKANDLLTKAVKTGLVKEDKKIFELLVSTHVNAKDIDLAIKKIKSSEYGNENKYKLILANLYYQKQEFKNSIAILDTMKTKRNTKTAGEKELLKALCFYELDDKKTSIRILKQVVKNPYQKKRARSILKSLES